jgi:hypothetical protein
MYVSFIISEQQVYNLLSLFQFSFDEQDRLIQEWTIERSLRTERPSFSEIRRFFQQGLLTVDQFLDELRGFGLHEKYIELYKKQITAAAGG